MSPTSAVGGDVPGPGGASRGLGARAARGGVVTIGGQVARICIQVLSVVLLARMLDPQDYGMLAMVLAVIGVGEILRDFGLSSAAIQSPTLSRGQRDNLLWVNTGIGAVLSLAAFASAPLVAAVYDEPELVPITRALAVTFLLNGVATQYRAGLVRGLRFTRLAVADVSAPALALVVALALAASGAGYWALVAQQLTQAVVLLLVVAVSARWLPGRPDRTASITGMLRFGGHLVGTSLVTYAANNADSLIIGSRFGSGALGYYNRGYQLLNSTVVQLRGPMTTVAVPVLSKLQDERERFNSYIRSGQAVLGYTLVVGMGFVVGAAEPLVDVALGPQWLAVVPILQLLAIASGMQTLAYVGLWVYISRGLTAQLLSYSVATSVVKIVAIAVGSVWGTVGVAGGIAVAAALEWPVSFWWLSRHTDLPRRDLVVGALRVLAVAVVAGALVLAAVTAVTASSAVEALAGLAVFAAAYGGAALVPAVRSDLRRITSVAVPALRRKASRPAS